MELLLHRPDHLSVEVERAGQWPTFCKAVRLGLITDQGEWTDKGREYVRVNSNRAEVATG